MSNKSLQREVFPTRMAFILAAVGSAIGLGNIWRFPYVAFESGGGAFLIPYLIALLTAGIPILFFDYVLGHRSRSSAPMSFRVISKKFEPLGWFQTGVATVIAIYYAVIIGWALSYTMFSVTEAWGDDAGTFFEATYLHAGELSLGSAFSFVPGVLIPLIIVWVVVLGILFLGVQGGIARFSKIFIPVLVVLFLALVIRSLFLPGAVDGLNALFTPDFAALADPQVWVAAYGQIFFSLSIGFGIMITYAAYLRRRTNLTGSGLVVAFSNSSFEILAGVGVFAALGFMAHSAGTGVEDVAAGGVGLAFVGFPTLISQMPGGALFGVLFFLSLVFAGLSSLISIIQVPIQAVAEKLGISNRASLGIVGGGMAVVSLLSMPTATGLTVLDVVDAFANNIGIVGGALLSIILVVWAKRATPLLRDHLNAISSFRIGTVWTVCLAVITPIVLGFMLISQIIAFITEGYTGTSADAIGWIVLAVLAVAAAVFTFIPWPKASLDFTARAVEANDADTKKYPELYTPARMTGHDDTPGAAGTTDPQAAERRTEGDNR
ncbi:sodium-dependent transporter [Brevibacterium sp. p3-SID960]|uniref:sodium-dependent transporter n=1 Tax=Brevibacterium sp. p3-SID960 TaxID=2916063 RepID=UPI0021A8F9F2|nr:sodium-dependent transporter [Brevibacterium sp. p3-SID960]MCT1689807.1 sodium-dependent transporter [Brevibacterium sp. p3-SID960]